jgi:hypothetical protein
MADPVVSSWVSFSLRELLGFEDTRNMVLERLVPPRSDIVFGKTFGSDSEPPRVVKYLKNIVKIYDGTSTTLVFHGINPPEDRETHYQTCIVDFQNHRVYLIDPAMTWKKVGRKYQPQPGVYKPFLSMNTLEPFFQEQNFDVSFVRTTYPCQDSEKDIYCQSWTLYLTVCFLSSNRTTPIDIPSDHLKRNGILLSFYKKIFSSLPELCIDLSEIYKDKIKRCPALVKGIQSKDERKKAREYYASIDACYHLLHKMKRQDLDE